MPRTQSATARPPHAGTYALLQHAGYAEVRFIEDPFAMFPTIVARKPAAF